jgi:hypothetical protein
MSFDPERLRPVMAVRATAGPWGLRLVIAAAVMGGAAAGLVAQAGTTELRETVLTVLTLGGFIAFSACAAQVTTRWRTSLRSDGWSLVVRAPFAVAEHSFGHELAIGRWLDDKRRRPEHWVIESGRIATPIQDAIDPVRVEAFALVVGIPVIDIPGAPPSAVTRGDGSSLGRDTPY